MQMHAKPLQANASLSLVLLTKPWAHISTRAPLSQPHPPPLPTRLPPPFGRRVPKPSPKNRAVVHARPPSHIPPAPPLPSETQELQYADSHGVPWVYVACRCAPPPRPHPPLRA